MKKNSEEDQGKVSKSKKGQCSSLRAIPSNRCSIRGPGTKSREPRHQHTSSHNPEKWRGRGRGGASTHTTSTKVVTRVTSIVQGRPGGRASCPERIQFVKFFLETEGGRQSCIGSIGSPLAAAAASPARRTARRARREEGRVRTRAGGRAREHRVLPRQLEKPQEREMQGGWSEDLALEKNAARGFALSSVGEGSKF